MNSVLLHEELKTLLCAIEKAMLVPDISDCNELATQVLFNGCGQRSLIRKETIERAFDFMENKISLDIDNRYDLTNEQKTKEKLRAKVICKQMEQAFISFVKHQGLLIS